MADLTVEQEVLKKLFGLGCRCSAYRNWKELSKDDWWNPFEWVIRRFFQSNWTSQHCIELNTVKKRMAVLKSALIQMDLSHKMLKKDDVNQLKKKATFHTLQAMLDRVDGKFPGCFSISHKWPQLAFPKSRLGSRKRKALSVNFANAGAMSNPNPPQKRQRRIAPVEVEIPCLEYTFNAADPNPFRKGTLTTLFQEDTSNVPDSPKFSEDEQTPQKQKPKENKTTVIRELPKSPFRREPKSPILEENLVIESQVLQKQKTVEEIPVLQPPKEQDEVQPVRNAEIPAPKVSLEKRKPIMQRKNLGRQQIVNIQQPQPRRVQAISSEFQSEKMPQIPEYKHVKTTFLTEKMKEYGDIAERLDLTPTEKLALMDENKRERKEFLKREKSRFLRECREHGLKLKWYDVLEPEFNFKMLELCKTM